MRKLENFFSAYQLPADIINFKGQITTLQKLKNERPELFKVDKTTGKSPFDEVSGMDKPMLNKNIDYGYAVTSHKGQGSTYKYVFVDYENMENPANKTIIKDNGVDYAVERQQLKYVGLSRASKIAFVFTRRGDRSVADSPQEIVNQPVYNQEYEETFVPSYDIVESTGDVYSQIREFYNTLTETQKLKLGSLEDLIEEYNQIPFDVIQSDFIEMKRCNL